MIEVMQLTQAEGDDMDETFEEDKNQRAKERDVFGPREGHL